MDSAAAVASESGNDPGDTGRSITISIPKELRIHSWKVRNGSPVRKGETLAIAVPVGAAVVVSVADNDSSASDKPQHKRPSKRKRTGAAAAVAAPPSASSTELGEGTESSSKKEAGTKSLLPSLTTTKASAAVSSITTTMKPDQVAVVAPADGILRIADAPVPPAAGDTKAATMTTHRSPDDVVIVAYIEACAHPAVIEGLCAVCGKSVSTKKGGDNNGDESIQFPASLPEHGTGENSNAAGDMSRVTVSGGVTVSISDQEGARIAAEDNERLRKQRKLSLVLDLDHTLVHATSDPRAKEHLRHFDVRSLLLPISEGRPGESQMMFAQHFVKLRPHVNEFLEMVQSTYELVVYTAGTREYAEQIAITLARHLVGASHDQIDLDFLQHKVAKMESEVRYNSDKVQNGGDGAKPPTETDGPSSAKKRRTVESADVSSGSTDDVPNTSNGTESSAQGSRTSSNEAGADNPGQKRKRVTFGEPPAAARSDHASQNELDRMRNELAEALRLESLAGQVRQRLFGSRVHSRSELGDLGSNVKSLKRIFPCGGTMAAVVDDREDVWANARDNSNSDVNNILWRKGEPPENLLLVRPYHFDVFSGFADVNNAAGTYVSAAEEEKMTSEQDQQLLWTRDILLRLHERYYSYDDVPNRPGVPAILHEMRNEVLRGCTLVLSGLVPLHRQNNAASEAPRPTVVRYAESLGAVVAPAVTSGVTHVVGAKDGTDKILSARRVPGCYVVKPSWLMECFWTITRRDERQHLLGAAPLPLPPPSSSSPKFPDERALQPIAAGRDANPSSSSSDTDDDDYDDDLAAELENEMLKEESV